MTTTTTAGCPECGSLACDVGLTMSTLAGFSPFYDVQGRLHVHDPNVHTEARTCINGHHYEHRRVRSCPAECGWTP